MVDAKTYRQHGFVIVRGLLSAAQADGLRADAWRVFRRQLTRRGLIGVGEVSEAELTGALYAFFRDHTAEFVNCGKQIQHLMSTYCASSGWKTRISALGQ
jgi:hypothetical protein